MTWAMKKGPLAPGCSVYIGDDILPSSVGIMYFIEPYKDSYLPTRFSWKAGRCLSWLKWSMEMTASEKLLVGLREAWIARIQIFAELLCTGRTWALEGTGQKRTKRPGFARKSSWNSEMEGGRELRRGYLKSFHSYRGLRSKPQVSKHILKEIHQSWWNNLDCCTNLRGVDGCRYGTSSRICCRSPELSVVFQEDPIQPKKELYES